MQRTGRLTMALTLTLLALSMSGQDLDSLRALRDSGKYSEAASLLAQRVTNDPSDIDAKRLLAETLSWLKRFDEAERIYAEVAASTGTPDDRIALARVYMWTQQYARARKLLEQLVKFHARSAALEELARLDYWTGDLRSAMVRFSTLRDQGRLSASGEKELLGIRATMKPAIRAHVKAGYDDQPYELVTSQIQFSGYLDPLSSYSISAGQHLASSDKKRFEVPFVAIGASIAFPRVRLSLQPSVRVVKFETGETRALPALTLMRRTESSALALRIDESELVSTRSSAATDVTERRVSLDYTREFRPGSAFSISTYVNRYSDENEGMGAHAYAIRPIFSRTSWQIYGGVSAAWRDTEESRFEISSTSAVPSGVDFRIRYKGIYNPYPTPQDQREARLIAGFVFKDERFPITTRFQLTGGAARDRAIAFGPEIDQTPTPITYSFSFEREYEPWDAALNLSWRTRSQIDLNVRIEHVSTAYYEANEVSASLVRRF